MIQTELVASFLQRSSFSTGPRGMPPAAYQGSVAKFDFLGKIQKSGVRNSMTYRLPNSRKSNFATAPDSCLSAVCAARYPSKDAHRGHKAVYAGAPPPL